MEREAIKKILPHREPMLLLDRVELLEEESVGETQQYAQGHYTVRGDEFFLQGHFPGSPIVPGVILCEILAQSACVLLQDTMQEGRIPVYTGLDKVRFRVPVRAGDTVVTKCSLTGVKHPFYFGKGTLSVDGKVCVSAEFSFAITEV